MGVPPSARRRSKSTQLTTKQSDTISFETIRNIPLAKLFVNLFTVLQQETINFFSIFSSSFFFILKKLKKAMRWLKIVCALMINGDIIFKLITIFLRTYKFPRFWTTNTHQYFWLLGKAPLSYSLSSWKREVRRTDFLKLQTTAKYLMSYSKKKKVKWRIKQLINK